MRSFLGVKKAMALVCFALLAGQTLLWGCQSLCTKRLYIYRESAESSLPPDQAALLITDPALAAALFPQAAAQLGGSMPWAPEQPAYETDMYRLSIQEVDGRILYQGLCLDSTLTEVCEVRPGARSVGGKVELLGPGGRQSLRNTANLDLAPGGVYFLHPDWAKMGEKNFLLKADRLPGSYDRALRTRLLDWQRRHTKGRSLEN